MRKSFVVSLLTVLIFSMSVGVYAQAPVTSIFNARFMQPEGVNMAQPLFLREVNQPILQDEGYYSESWVTKMGTGVINTVTSWVDLPRKVTEVSAEKNVLMGATFGLSEGIATGLARGISGVYDVATFGVSPYNKPAMKPEYKVDKPNEGLKIKIFKW